MSYKTVKVRRVVVVEYETPMPAYPGMTEDEIRRRETDEADPGLLLDNIVSEAIEVTFVDAEDPR